MNNGRNGPVNKHPLISESFLPILPSMSECTTRRDGIEDIRDGVAGSGNCLVDGSLSVDDIR